MRPGSSERGQGSTDLGWKLQGLTRAAVAVNSSLTLTEVLQVITEQARLVVGTHQAITSFLGPEARAEAISVVSLSEKYAAWRGYREPITGEGIYRLVLEENRPYRMTQEELENHPAFRGFGEAAARHPPLRGWLAAPIIDRKGRNVGVIQLSDKLDGGEFGEEDESLLVQLAQMTAVAIDNAHLYAVEHAEKERAEDAVRSRDSFISVAAHELRTPITTLGLQLDLLRREAERLVGSERLLDRIHVTRRQLDRLAGLVSALVDVTKATSGRLELSLEDVDLCEVATEVVDRLGPSAELAGSKLRLERPVSLVGRWDRGRIDQVLTNLVSNAIKYGCGRPIEVSLVAVDGEASIEVRDHGAGISPENLERIFERFERFGEDPNGGLGLGLWITWQIVSGLGGVIKVESNPGEGSLFRVILPLDSRYGHNLEVRESETAAP